MSDSNSNQGRPLTRTLSRLALCITLPFGVVLIALFVNAVIPRTGEESTSAESAGPQATAAAEIDDRTSHDSMSDDSGAITETHAVLDAREVTEFYPEAESAAQQPAEPDAVPRHAGPPVWLVSHEQSTSKQTHAEGVPATPINLAWVDSLIQSGNYPFASQLLEEFDLHSSGLVQLQIRLRRGLCAELQGSSQTALTHYSSLAASSQSTEVSDAATLASARILIERGRRDVGIAMLMRLFLSRERLMRKDMRGDVVHTLATGLTSDTETESLLEDSGWLIARRIPTPEEMLHSWANFADTEPARPAGIAFYVRKLTSSPRGVLVSMRAESISIEEFLHKLTSDLNWKLSTDESVRNLHLDRTLSVDFEELPLDILLDAIVTPLGAKWNYNEKVLSVVSPTTSADRMTKHDGVDDVDATEREELLMADRFLQLAVSIAPEHPAAPLSYVLLGTTAAKLGDIDGAINYFQTTLELFPRVPSRGATTFNLGKACLASGQRDEALKHFFRTVDRVSGPQADAIAYLYIGRILLENDTAKDSIMPLMRGLSLAEDTEYEGPATLLLSAAYLLSGNAAGANTVLVDHRLAFETNKELATQAAFLSSLARFWGSSGIQRIREGRATLSSLTSVKVDKMFGGHCAYLVGVGFGAVGLSSEEDATFRRCLSEPYRFPLQQRMRQRLSGEMKAEDSLNAGPGNRVGASTANNADGATSATDPEDDIISLIGAAEVAFRSGNNDQVMELCQQILDEPSMKDPDSSDESEAENVQQVRKSALRLMGFVFQSRGRHDLAVRCLAGVAPKRSADQNKQSPKEQLP